MTNDTYYSPTGGLPPQTQILTDRAMFTEAYAVIPKGTYSDIVTSFLPFWTGMRMWVISRPLSGFAETRQRLPCCARSASRGRFPASGR